MFSKKMIAILAVIVVVLAVGYGKFSGQAVKTESVGVQNETGIVGRVVDGDTFVLTDGERVRPIGFDTPEKGEKCFEEAKERMRDLVEGKSVVMERDATERDRYDRLLRYVFVDGDFVNLIMVREGFARVYTIKPDVKYVEEFEEALVRAREEGTGCLWR